MLVKLTPEQLSHRFSSPKKLQSQTVIKEKLCKTLLYEKPARKIFVKSTPALFSFF